MENYISRLGIFIFYDGKGIVDDYIIYLLNEMKKMISYQVIVVNGEVGSDCLKSLQLYADKLVFRENNGFDGGAYQDIFLNYFTQDELICYEEVVLFNNSFYGPFYSLDVMWNKLENIQTDFWGITRYPGCQCADGFVFSKHIESYFLVIRKRMLVSDWFMKFWKNGIILGENLSDVVKGFEDRFTVYFEEHGFKSAALTDLPEWDISMQQGDIPYMLYSFELISKRLSPFLKRKSLMLSNDGLDNAVKAFQYIKFNTGYDTAMIENHIRRLDDNGEFDSHWRISELEKFYFSHEKVYIFGNGKFSKGIKAFFEYKGWNIAGILVSNENEVKFDEVPFDKNMISNDDGVIVALGKKNMDSVLPLLKDKLDTRQLLFPRYN